MRVLDLFCGMKGWSDPAAERGHEVVTLDFEERFEPTICADILEVTAADIVVDGGGHPDIILASPPCESFSVGSIGKHWTSPPENAPKTDEARHGLRILEATIDLIQSLDPAFWVLENPDGKMKRMEVLYPFEMIVVDYCQYGDIAQKRTCLWGGFPPSFVPRRRCRATGGPIVEHLGKAYRMDRVTREPCHEKAARGDKTGTQGKGDAAERAVIPPALALDVILAAEKDLGRAVGSGKVALF